MGIPSFDDPESQACGRVGPDEMQYFDHPKFGAIISIKPVLTDTK